MKIFMFCLSVSAMISIAIADNVWQGKADGRWENPANWSAGKAPARNDNEAVLIPQTADKAAQYPAITGRAEVYESVTVAGELVVAEGAALTIYIKSHNGGLWVKTNGYVKVRSGAAIRINTYNCAKRIHNVGYFSLAGKFEAVGRPDKRIYLGGDGTIIMGMIIGEQSGVELNCVDLGGAYNLFQLGVNDACRFAHVKNAGNIGYLDFHHQGGILKVEDCCFSTTSLIRAGRDASKTEFNQCRLAEWYGGYTKNTGKEWGINTSQLIDGWIVSRNDLGDKGAYVFYPGWKGMDWRSASIPPSENDRVIIRNGVDAEEIRWVRLSNDAACKSIFIEKNAGLDLNGHTLTTSVCSNDGVVFLNSGRIRLPGGQYRLTEAEAGKVEQGAPPLREISSKHFGLMDSQQWETGKAPLTPHLDWAKPYCRGKIKALFLTTDESAREIYELGERFDLEIHTLLFPIQKVFFDYNPADFVTMNTLREVLNNERFDCLINYGVPADCLSGDMQKMIAEKVKDGMGYLSLLPQDGTGLEPVNLAARKTEETKRAPWLPVRDGRSIGPWKRQRDHYISRHIPIDVLPETYRFRYAPRNGQPVIVSAPRKDGQTIESGEDAILSVLDNNRTGRIASLIFAGSYWPTTSMLPFPMQDGPFGFARYHYENDWSYWELYYNLLGRAVLWAAHKDPGVQLDNIRLNKSTIWRNEDRDVLADVSFAAGLNLKGALAVSLFNKRFEMIHETIAPVEIRSKAVKPVQVAIPVANLPADLYFLVFTLRDSKQQKVDWGVVPLEVKSRLRLERVKTERDCYKPEEPVVIKLDVTNDLLAPQAAEVSLAVYDAFNRLILKESHAATVSAAGSNELEHVIRMPATRLLTGYYRLEAGLSDGQGVIQRKHCSLWMPQDPRSQFDDFQVGIWMGPVHPHLVPLQFEQWRRLLGASFVVNGGGNSDDEATANNFWTVHENIWYLGRGRVDADGVRPMCLSNPQVLKGGKKKVSDFVARRKPLNMLGYAIGEEMNLSGGEVCFSSWCQERYRAWLKDQYGSLGSLNHEWEKNYKGWEEVKGARSTELKQLPNPAPFVDFRLFMEYVWADAFRQFGEWVRETDPKALGGYDCSAYADSVFEGWGGLSLIGPITEVSVEYYHPWSLEVLRSTMSRPYLLVTGYYYGEANYRFIPWWVMLHGGGGVSYYESLDYCRHLTPFYEPNRFTDMVAESIKDLREGCGKIILTSRRQNDGIAVLYSRPRVMFDWVTSQLAMTNMPPGNKSPVEELPLQYDYVTEQQLAEGKLDQYKALVLLSMTTLSETQWELIHEYVTRGGTVIGDLRTGLADEHGKSVKDNGYLENVFGIRRPKNQAFKPGKEKMVWSEEGLRKEFLSLGKARVELTSGKALGLYPDNTPAVILNQAGQGKAIYVNGVFEDRNLWTMIFGLAGISKSVAIVNPATSEALDHYEVVRFVNGGLEYIAVQRALDAPRPDQENAALFFTRQNYLYDVREKKCLGYTNQAQAVFAKGATKFYLLAPYQVKSVALHVPAHVKAGDALPYAISLNVSNGRPYDHVYRVEVYQPDGALSYTYTKNVLSRGGEYKGVIPLALNEKTGKWKLRVTETSSGKQSEQYCIIESSK